MESVQTEFSVSLPDKFGTILPGETIDVKVTRIAESPPEVRSGAYDRIKFYWRLLGENETPLLSHPNCETLERLWDIATQRAKAKGSGIGVTIVPIEVFNTNITQRPYETWKDPTEWTPFTYRPSVEDKGASFSPEGSAPCTGGAFGSLWKCRMKFDGDTTVYPVAVKEIRLSQVVLQVSLNRQNIFTRAEKELNIWKKLNHENIGMIIGWLLEPSVALISPWYPNGDVLSFVQGLGHLLLGEQRVTRWELVKEITNGMEYLHSQNVVHGDLRHDQVLVDGDGHAKIVDFGLSKVIEDGVDTKITTSIRHKGRYEYMAPELLLQTPPRLKESDVYAFSLLILEVAISRVAFDGLTPGPAQVTRSTLEKTHLPQPARFRGVLLEQSVLWDIFGKCTTFFPRDRPPMQIIRKQIHSVRSPLETIYAPIRDQRMQELVTQRDSRAMK